ncbi:hypothetical protein AAG906_024644 [Vitis piasezkii]
MDQLQSLLSLLLRLPSPASISVEKSDFSVSPPNFNSSRHFDLWIRPTVVGVVYGVSNATSMVAQIQGGGSREGFGAIRAKILTHPLYPKLLHAYIECRRSERHRMWRSLEEIREEASFAEETLLPLAWVRIPSWMSSWNPLRCLDEI